MYNIILPHCNERLKLLKLFANAKINSSAAVWEPGRTFGSDQKIPNSIRNWFNMLVGVSDR